MGNKNHVLSRRRFLEAGLAFALLHRPYVTYI